MHINKIDWHTCFPLLNSRVLPFSEHISIVCGVVWPTGAIFIANPILVLGLICLLQSVRWCSRSFGKRKRELGKCERAKEVLVVKVVVQHTLLEKEKLWSCRNSEAKSESGEPAAAANIFYHIKRIYVVYFPFILIHPLDVCITFLVLNRKSKFKFSGDRGRWSVCLFCGYRGCSCSPADFIWIPTHILSCLQYQLLYGMYLRIKCTWNASLYK